MADLNATFGVLAPVLETSHALVKSLQYLVGGMFGIYLIGIVIRWHTAKKNNKLLKELNTNIINLNKTLSKRKRK